MKQGISKYIRLFENLFGIILQLVYIVEKEDGYHENTDKCPG